MARQAVNNPVTRDFAGEFSTDEVAPRQPVAFEDPEDRELVIADGSNSATDYVDELAFMEEPVTIRIHRRAEKFPPAYEMAGVNGKIIWIPVEQPTTIKRCFVESLARAMSTSIEHISGESPGDDLTFNKIVPTNSALFAFSVLKDTPKGMDWFNKLLYQR